MDEMMQKLWGAVIVLVLASIVWSELRKSDD